MNRSTVPAALAMVAVLACGEADSGVGPVIDLSGTSFDYWLGFMPSDSVFGGGGRVRGIGATWRMSPTGSFTLELRSSPVAGTDGNTRVDVVLTNFPVDSGNIPQPGQYQVGPVTALVDGRAFLRDPTRLWVSDSLGIVILSEFRDDGFLDGQVALKVTRQQVDPFGAVTDQAVSVVGTFTAIRVPDQGPSATTRSAAIRSDRVARHAARATAQRTIPRRH